MLLKCLTYAAVLIFTPDYVFSQKITRNKRASNTIPCELGWFYFNEKCYKIGGAKQKLNWEKAAEQCVGLGAHLATIESKEENDFLVGLLLLEVKDSAWIGLNDRANESEYVWEDGSKSDFRHWRANEPSGVNREHEDCVQVLVDLYYDSVGEWNDNDCGHSVGYICETDKNPDRRSPNPRYCSAEEGGGFRFQKSCYQLVTVMQTWENAEKYCRDRYDGHLITILDTTADLYLYYLFQSSLSTELWIGIKMQDRFQQKWTSGWFVGYNGFVKEHRDFLDGTCVVRKKRKEWMIVPCSKKFSFICEKSFGKAPVLKPPPKDSHCPKIPDDWRDMDGESCYFIDTQDAVSWYEANFRCMRRGGNLLSIHSKEESGILHPFIQHTRVAAFIGLFRLWGQENVFGWTDGSQLDFIDWSHGEPNNENEKCVEARSNDMKWNDIPCEEKRAYICSVKKITPNTSTTTEKLEGEVKCPGNVSVKALIGVAVCMVLVIILLGVVIYYFRQGNVERKKTSSAMCIQPPSPGLNSQKYRSAEIRIKEQDCYYESMEA